MGIFAQIEKRAGYSSKAVQWAKDVESQTSTTAAGQDVDRMDAQVVTSVWACQSLIADAIACLPIDTFRKVSGRRKAIDPPAWITKPDPFKTPYTFWFEVMISLLGDGNAFIRKVKDGNGNIVGLKVYHPYWVEVDEDTPQPLYHIGEGDDAEDLTQADMIHIPAFVKPGFRRGLSPIEENREAIGLAMAAQEFGARFYSQGTTLSGVIEHPGVPKAGEAALLRAMFRKNYSGVKNSHAVGIITGGGTWKSISITPEQAQFLETRRFLSVQIGQLYRIPAYLMDPTVQSSWGTGIAEQNQFLVTYTLTPWLTRIEQAISDLLPRGQFIKFNTDAWLKGRLADRMDVYTKALANGVYCLDEVRALEDLEPLPNGLGKTFTRPSNLTELTKDKPKPAPQNPPVPPGADPNAPPDTNADPAQQNGTNGDPNLAAA